MGGGWQIGDAVMNLRRVCAAFAADRHESSRNNASILHVLVNFFFFGEQGRRERYFFFFTYIAVDDTYSSQFNSQLALLG